MAVLQQSGHQVQPLAQAALLLAAHTLSKKLGLAGPSPAKVLEVTGVSRSRAYELRSALLASLDPLIRRPGRPRNAQVAAPAASDDESAITSAVLAYVLGHPGSAQIRGHRGIYDDGFRLFVVELRAKNPHIPIDSFARAVRVPVGTLKVWMAAARSAPRRPGVDAGVDPADTSGRSDKQGSEHTPLGATAVAQIETVVAEWISWSGSFVAFCDYVRDQLRIPIGRQFIKHILEAVGVRIPRRRQRRSPDEVAMRGAFETFFAGAQWVGDGKSVDVRINGNPYTCNLELQVDAHSDAWVGLDVRAQEDSAAVIESFENGIATTGAPPTAELLDNKPCNHTPEVDEALSSHETLRMRSTTGRPQNKAHVEGAFGLFAQHAPAIELDTTADEPCIARALVLLVATTFACAINQRPRTDRGGRSRADLYAEEPSQQQIDYACRELQQRWRNQEKARLTREARQRPQVRELLDREFDALGLLDPERHIRVAIGGYPLDAIVDGIAVFKAKRDSGTLPQDADGRYLLGIVRNLSAQRECECIAVRLLEQRLSARDAALASLGVERDAICRPDRTICDVVHDCIAAALETDRRLDRLFWLSVATDQIREQDQAAHPQLYRAAARRIGTAFRIPPRQRQEAIRFLADRLIPIH